jgi:hypothetical protein
LSAGAKWVKINLKFLRRKSDAKQDSDLDLSRNLDSDIHYGSRLSTIGASADTSANASTRAGTNTRAGANAITSTHDL